MESRGKAVRRQALTPIPSARTLEAINQALLARMDARLATGRDGAGETIGARFAVDAPAFRALPAPFVAAAMTFVTVAPRALVRVEGTWYSVPCRWAGLDLVACVGATTVTVVGRDGTPIRHPRKRFGQRSIDYRHYLPELVKKPQAVRQELRLRRVEVLIIDELGFVPIDRVGGELLFNLITDRYEPRYGRGHQSGVCGVGDRLRRRREAHDGAPRPPRASRHGDHQQGKELSHAEAPRSGLTARVRSQGVCSA